MDVNPRHLRLHYPKGNQWRALLKLPDIAASTVNLNDPTSEAMISFRPGTDEARIREIVSVFEAALDPDSGPVELI